MAALVHCMMCFVIPNKDIKFYISSCGHLSCMKCVEKGAFTLKCKVCQKDSPQSLEINSKLKPELTAMFTSFSTGMASTLNKISQCIEFQQGHRDCLVKNLSHKSKNFDKLQAYCKVEIQKKNEYKQEIIKSRMEAEKLKKEMTAMKNQLILLKRGSEASANTSTSAAMTSMMADPFRTPGPMSGRERSFVTSTPLIPRSGQNINNITDPAYDSSTNMSFLNQTEANFSAAGIVISSLDNTNGVSNITEQLTSASCSNEFGQGAASGHRSLKDQLKSGPATKNNTTTDISMESTSSVSVQEVSPILKNLVTPAVCRQPNVVRSKEAGGKENVFTKPRAPVAKKNPSRDSSQPPSLNKTPIKKLKLDITSRTMPLPIKSV